MVLQIQGAHTGNTDSGPISLFLGIETAERVTGALYQTPILEAMLTAAVFKKATNGTQLEACQC